MFYFGPITVAKCGALCPSYKRGCYECFGPVEKQKLGLEEEDIKELLKT